MSNLTPQLVDRYIKPFKNKYSLVKKNFKTDDIVNEIIAVDSSNAYLDVMELSKHIEYTDLNDLSLSLFTLLKEYVSYQEDGIGFQGVRSPSALWATKQGDCKSYSIFVGSVLKCLGIPYMYRFASYGTPPRLQHIYPIALGKNNDFIIDAVYGKYNKEKPYNLKKDFTMEGLYRIEGVGAQNEPIARMPKPIGEMSEADMDLFIARQRLEIERDIAAKKGGIGAVKANEYQHTINGLDNFIGAVNSNDLDAIDSVINSVQNPHTRSWLRKVKDKHIVNRPAFVMQLTEDRFNHLAGIGAIDVVAIGWSFKKLVKSVKKIVPNVTKALDKVAAKAIKAMPKPLQKVATLTLKTVTAPTKLMVKATQAVAEVSVKALTLPLQLVAKGAIEVMLPKVSTGFMYLFINDPAIIAALPEKVRNKRKKQEGYADFIVEGIGMKREHLMGILRNGIMKNTGKSPEQNIAEMIKKPSVAGIGIAFLALIPLFIALFDMIGKLFKSKDKPKVTAADLPAPDDFAVKTTTVAKSTQAVANAANAVAQANTIIGQANAAQANLAQIRAAANADPNNVDLAQLLKEQTAKTTILAQEAVAASQAANTAKMQADVPATQAELLEKKANLSLMANAVVAQNDESKTTAIPATGGRRVQGICG